MPRQVPPITPDVELDLGRYELRRRGRRVKLARKPMELLIFLVARRGQLVSREEIVSRLWRSDLFVDTEPNINNIVRKIRAALGDNSVRPRFLETVVGKGYRFVGPIQVIDARLAPPSAAGTRQSPDPLAHAEFLRGSQLSSSGDPAHLDEAAQHLMEAVRRDPEFALAHAALSFVCATRHFEFDPTSAWLERAEFHCTRSLELDPNLAEAHLAKAFLLWGPSKNFQHLEAIAELRCALALDRQLPHAYNRLGTILAHIGLLDRAREMYERARRFHPNNAVSHSIVQVYLWNRDYTLASREVDAWRAETPGNKYPVYYAPQIAVRTGDFDRARSLLGEAARLLPEEPLIISLHALFDALTGDEERALEGIRQACAIPKSFGHAHHTYYHIACALSVLGRERAAFEWLERSVSTGFACWPFFVKDPCLRNLQSLPAFGLLISSLQAKYPDHLGVL
jgi:DNA-binding winged helix-turn-helix (wHTH) protein